MTNIMNNVVDYIDGLTLYSPLIIDAFMSDLEEIMIRHEAGSAKTTTYMDGSREGQFNFSLFTKSTDAEKASSQLSSLITDLDLVSGLKLTELLTIKIEPVSSVRFITKTENLEFIYSSDFVVNYLEKRR